MDFETQLKETAERLTREAKKASNGATAVIEVKATAIVTLAFDPGDTITPQMLRSALKENFAQIVDMSEDGCIDQLEVDEIRDE